MTLDRRLHAYRPDLADARLKGQVEAARFVDGDIHEVIHDNAPLRREPRHDAALDTEALYGERVRVYEIDEEGWAWGQIEGDGYVGYLPAAALVRAGLPATHTVTSLRTHGFPGPDIKLPPFVALPLGSRVAVTGEDGAFAGTAAGLYVPLRPGAPLPPHEADYIAVAERFVGTPYLWGGQSSLGIDCSGLVQIAFNATGHACPRDSDMQCDELGATLPEGAALARGDLVFWKGHVGIMLDAEQLLHSNGHHMATVIEPLARARDRIAAAREGTVLRIARLDEAHLRR